MEEKRKEWFQEGISDSFSFLCQTTVLEFKFSGVYTFKNKTFDKCWKYSVAQIKTKRSAPLIEHSVVT